MGRLAKTLARWDRTEGAATKLEQAIYRLARDVFAGGYYDTAQMDADAAARKYAKAVAHATHTGGDELIPEIVADRVARTVTVRWIDAYGNPYTIWTITPETID